jgi:hypothetical protein
MNNFQSKASQFSNVPVKPYNPNSRASRMQKGFITPELKVARYLGAELFDYDYSQDETNNILTYAINLKNNEDVFYINYRLQKLVKYVRNNIAENLRFKFPCIFIEVCYKDIVPNETVNKYIVISNNGFKDSEYLNTYLYDIDQFVNKFIYFHTPCILTINIVELYRFIEDISEFNLNEIKRILYGIPNPISSADVTEQTRTYYKSLFSFVNLFEKERFYTKWWKMYKYIKYRLMQ